jgi:hypothetical protein
MSIGLDFSEVEVSNGWGGEKVVVSCFEGYFSLLFFVVPRQPLGICSR